MNHQPSWVKLGLSGATEALTWGCNDIGGTLMEEHITTMAGAQGGTCMTVDALRGAIASLNRPARQRDTLYGLVSSSGTVSGGKTSGSRESSDDTPASSALSGKTAPARQSRSQSLIA